VATVVDALTVTLGLDASQFKVGQETAQKNLKATQEAATHTAKEMQASGAQAAEFFSQIKTEALALLGIFLGGKGLETFVRDTTKSMAGLGDAARDIGMAVTDLSDFERAIERMGGSAGSAESALQGIAKAVQQFKTFGDNPQFAAMLGQIGATPDMSAWQIMQRYNEFVRTHMNAPGGYQQIQQYGGLLGVPQDVTTALLRLNRSSTLDAEMKLSDNLLHVTQQMTDDFARFQTSVTKFDQAVSGLSTSLLDKFLPWLTDEMNSITKELMRSKLTPEEQRKAIHDYVQSPGTRPLWDYFFPGNDLGNRPGLTPGHYGPGPRAGVWGNSTQREKAGQDSLSFWMGKGLTSEQAAGMAAQEMAESGGNPGARGDYVNGIATASGAYQWHSDRRARILAATGIDVANASIDQQREAAYWELTHTESDTWNRLRNARSAAEAGNIATGFERPGNRLSEQVNRGWIANGILTRRNRSTPGTESDVSAHGDMSEHLAPWQLEVPRTLPGPRSSNDDNSTTVTIGNVNVHTQATDAKGIASDLTKEIANQANRGLN
jgi:hypothetical protein